jgi:oxygen-independent coproporphyrinogen-3 oxidase
VSWSRPERKSASTSRASCHRRGTGAAGGGPTAISQFAHLFSQNERDLKAYDAGLERGELPVVRGLVELSETQGSGLARVTLPGRWLIRTIAAVFDPEQGRRAAGSRLV